MHGHVPMGSIGSVAEAVPAEDAAVIADRENR
jgi:hypothetical protein